MKIKNGLWIAIDGFDAVGKTTQIGLVTNQLKLDNISPIVEIPEFSSSPIGQTIQKILSKNRFYSLKKDKTSPFADTMLLLSDMVYQLESDILPIVKKQGIAISDRGSISFVAYQAVRIAERVPNTTLKQAVKWCSQLVRDCGIKPELTILIDISEDELKKRVFERESIPLSSDDLVFLRRVKNALPLVTKKLHCKTITVNGERSIKEISMEISKIILSTIQNK